MDIWLVAVIDAAFFVLGAILGGRYGWRRGFAAAWADLRDWSSRAGLLLHEQGKDEAAQAWLEALNATADYDDK